MVDSINILGEGAIAALVQMWGEVAGFIPNLAGALVILVVGYIAARIAGAGVRRLLAAVGFDRLSERAGLAAVLDRMNVTRTASGIMGRIVFWILMLVFQLSASESLGLDRLSGTIDSLVQYLPRVLGAVFILAIGLFAATFARDAVRAAAANIGSEHANTLGHATYGLLTVIAVALAIGQLELESGLLTVAVGIVMTAAGVAAALACGLGSREVAAHVLAGAYLRDNYPPGTCIAVDGAQGEVKAVEALATVVATEDGNVCVPNMLLVRGTVRITAAADEHPEEPAS